MDFVSLLKKYAILIIVLAIIIVLGIVYNLGFRVSGAGITRIGTVTLTNLPTGTNVYVDGVLGKSVEATSSAKLEMVPGMHSVIIGAPNDYPWSKTINVTSGGNLQTDPILVNTNPKVIALSGSDQKQALQAIASSTLPTQDAPFVMENGCADVYTANNQLIVDVASSTPGCTPPAYLCTGTSCGPTIIFSPVAKMDNVFPYPHRQDAIAVSVGGTLYVLALDPTSPQFFAPIARGTGATFGMLSDGTIVAHDGTLVAKLNL